jgi:hypothetical protein
MIIWWLIIADIYLAFWFSRSLVLFAAIKGDICGDLRQDFSEFCIKVFEEKWAFHQFACNIRIFNAHDAFLRISVAQ